MPTSDLYEVYAIKYAELMREARANVVAGAAREKVIAGVAI